METWVSNADDVDSVDADNYNNDDEDEDDRNEWMDGWMIRMLIVMFDNVELSIFFFFFFFFSILDSIVKLNRCLEVARMITGNPAAT